MPNEPHLCPICKKEIHPRRPTVSMVGGFFDEAEPAFFVEDQDIMTESYVHRDCLLEKLLAK